MSDLSPNDITSMRNTSTAFMPLTCSVFRTIITVNAGGDRVKSYSLTPTYSNVPIDIVEVTGSSGTPQSVASGYQTAIRYEGYIPAEYDIQNNDKIRDEFGREFAVGSLSGVDNSQDDMEFDIIVALVELG